MADLVNNKLTLIQLESAETLETLQGLDKLVRKFIGATGMSARRFGVSAVGDPDFVKKLTEGRKVPGGGRRPCSFTLETVNRVLTFIRDWRE